MLLIVVCSVQSIEIQSAVDESSPSSSLPVPSVDIIQSPPSPPPPPSLDFNVTTPTTPSGAQLLISQEDVKLAVEQAIASLTSNNFTTSSGSTSFFYFLKYFHFPLSSSSLSPGCAARAHLFRLGNNRQLGDPLNSI